MPWKINKNDKEVIVSLDDLGNFKTKEEAVEEAKKLAREYKLVVRVFIQEEEKLDEEFMTIDYTNFFNSQEMVERTISELKLAKAEKNVAKLEFEHRKAELKKNKNLNETIAYKEKVRNSKIRLKKAKLNLKAAKKRVKLINSSKD